MRFRKNVAQRAAYWRWAGFLALNLIRRTKVQFSTFVDAKHFSPAFGNTLCLLHNSNQI